MQAKHKLSATVLAALLSAVVPAVTHAESQQAWFLRQLQMTDGYMPETSAVAPKQRDGNTSWTDTKAAKGAQGRPGHMGARKEGGGDSALIGNPKNSYNGFSPYASDPQYSP